MRSVVQSDTSSEHRYWSGNINTCGVLRRIEDIPGTNDAMMYVGKPLPSMVFIARMRTSKVC